MLLQLGTCSLPRVHEYTHMQASTNVFKQSEDVALMQL
jgi:hypothetical protein